jgi:hypothetical protein
MKGTIINERLPTISRKSSNHGAKITENKKGKREWEIKNDKKRKEEEKEGQGRETRLLLSCSDLCCFTYASLVTTNSFKLSNTYLPRYQLTKDRGTVGS